MKSASQLPIQNKRAEIWLASNELRPIRPAVYLAPQNGWNELVGEKDLLCENPLLKQVEKRLRNLKKMQVRNMESI